MDAVRVTDAGFHRLMEWCHPVKRMDIWSCALTPIQMRVELTPILFSYVN